MATKKRSKNTGDERRAAGRFMDQPGQWRDTTPKSVKKRNAAGWKKLEKSLKATKKGK